MKKRLRWIVPLVIVTVAAGAFFARPRRARTPSPAEAVASTQTDSRRARAEIDTVSVRLAETGLIQPKTMVLVKSMVSGKVVRLHVREGQDVARGDLLAAVGPDMAQARTVASLKSGYGRAKVDLERSRQDYERDLELHANGHISDAKLKLSQDAYDIARIEYQSAHEQLQLAAEDGVTVDEAEPQAGRLLDILAPCAGTIINLDIEEGEIVTSGAVSYTSGTTLMTIADLSVMQIKAGVNEVDIGKIRRGQAVKIDVDAYPGVTFEGRIASVAPAARDEEGVKIFDVEIDITESDARLRPNMTANIEIQGDHRAGVLAIPIEAAFKKQGRYVAYVFDGSPQEPVARDIVTGVANIEKIEIVSGLAAGEVVARYDPELEGRDNSEDALRRRRMAAGARNR